MGISRNIRLGGFVEFVELLRPACRLYMVYRAQRVYIVICYMVSDSKVTDKPG